MIDKNEVKETVDSEARQVFSKFKAVRTPGIENLQT